MEHLLTRELLLGACSGQCHEPTCLSTEVSKDVGGHFKPIDRGHPRTLFFDVIMTIDSSMLVMASQERVRSSVRIFLFSTTQCCELPEQFTLSFVEG